MVLTHSSKDVYEKFSFGDNLLYFVVVCHINLESARQERDTSYLAADLGFLSTCHFSPEAVVGSASLLNEILIDDALYGYCWK